MKTRKVRGLSDKQLIAVLQRHSLLLAYLLEKVGPPPADVVTEATTPVVETPPASSDEAH